MRNTIFLVFIVLAGCAPKAGDREVAIAFYNCENFFDTVHNPAKEDEEFTPGGKYHYTQAIYENKLHNIATVLQGMGGPDGPALIGLAEIENNIVLNDLVRQPEIAARRYKYEWYDGPDPRGINVALLYDPSRFRVLRSEALHVPLDELWNDDGVAQRPVTRDVLHVYGILGNDSVHLFVNHWPSRRGEEEASGKKRAMAAGVERKAIDVVMAADPGAEVIVMGDFNDNPDDASITTILGAAGTASDVSATGLFDPFAAIYKSGLGTEVYQHNWNLFDQVMVSGRLLAGRTSKYHYDKAEIYKPDFITDHYEGHEDQPHRSFAGPHWINGYSDHFPVILYLAR